MAKQCGKCKGTGWLGKRQSIGLQQFISGNTGGRRCDVCDGSGNDLRWTEKSCEKCGWRKIEYRRDWSNPPKYCDSCKDTVRREKEQKQREREQENAKWREKSCRGLKGQGYCGKTIKYRIDWNRIPDICPDCIAKSKAEKAQREANKRTKPCKHCGKTLTYYIGGKEFDYCKECNEWKEKACATGDCANQVRYKVYFDNPPNYCDACKEKRRSHSNKRQITEGDIYRSELVPRGWTNTHGNVQIEKGHVTMYFPGKGTNGATYRVSWNGYGEAHYTDQGLPPGHPDRHRDPRR
jgi:hypothetical protein